MNKKGSQMVEATIVLPLVILSIMAVILIMTYMYNEVATKTKIHVALNAKMGEENNIVKTYKNVPSGITIYEKFYNLNQCYFGEEELFFKKSGLLSKSISKTLMGRVYSIDEKKLIRYTDFFKDGESDDK